MSTQELGEINQTTYSFHSSHNQSIFLSYIVVSVKTSRLEVTILAFMLFIVNFMTSSLPCLRTRYTQLNTTTPAEFFLSRWTCMHKKCTILALQDNLFWEKSKLGIRSERGFLFNRGHYILPATAKDRHAHPSDQNNYVQMGRQMHGVTSSVLELLLTATRAKVDLNKGLAQSRF